MASPQIEKKPHILEETQIHAPWTVILFNDEVHTFDEVIIQLVKATGCALHEAEALTWEVHIRGKAIVYQGDIESCLRVSSILREIELITEITG